MIPMNDFERLWKETGPAVHAAVESVGASGWYVLGSQVREFEAALAAFWKFEHAAGVASGLDALEIALRVLGCRPGDKVLTTPLSAFATTLAIVRLGAVPVFADTDRFGLIDLDACADALRRDSAIRFFVPVHLYGHALDMARLRGIISTFPVKVVEDCAQSIGAFHRGEFTGHAGAAAATSFYPTKNLGCIGDGGAVLTNDAAVAGAVRACRDYGQTAKYRHEVVGCNSRLDELQAAVLRLAFLPRLDGWTSRRRHVASRYLAGISNSAVRPLGAPPGSDSCWHLFPVMVDPPRKAEFISYLRGKGITCGEHYPIPAFEQKALSGIPFEMHSPCASAAGLCRGEVSLPIHPYLMPEEVDSVIQAVNSWPG
jgi:dTDP-3-amino-3,4,6-trideoxy-alpha-D-glucose transaminase